ncbi:hypothetical protein [Niallia sp. MER TA 168]|uniref:hypothetical protein n=1 Tax=Niallia sp. MER TA 168 TaxID=2939568 RepID=UPI00203E0490|nr:hypothetical protein [Niallia sp. MER TA 168]MCM3363167.1 hypothetical protein [Niallia sp. MER TA 168]
MEQLRSLVFDLDCEISAVGNTLVDLDDAEKFLGELVEEMGEAVYKGEEMAYYNKHFRDVRILSQLFRQALSDLNMQHSKANKLGKILFGEVVRKQKSSGDPYVDCEIEMAKKQNRKAFTEIHNREPVSDEEVDSWINMILEKSKKKAV